MDFITKLRKITMGSIDFLKWLGNELRNIVQIPFDSGHLETSIEYVN